MTENEERLEELMDAICRLVSIAEDSICREGFEELDNAGAEIIGCLEELEQYRAIGTVEELTALKENCIEPSSLRLYLTQLEKYHAIGTIEEFKALKEKNVAKKAIGKRKYDEAYCPACNEVISDGEFWSLAEYVHHCNYCGQAVKGVDWSE